MLTGENDVFSAVVTVLEGRRLNRMCCAVMSL